MKMCIFYSLIATLSLTPSVSNAQTQKTLVYCSEGNPESFNPQLTLSGTASIATYSTLYDRLIELNPEASKLVPSLATHWTISPDQLTYTFHLRKDVQFHSTSYFTPTRSMNADDVLFSFGRQLNPDHEYHRIGGGNYPYFQGTGMNTLIQSIKKLDDFTIQIKLHRPEGPFLSHIAMNFMSILSAEYASQLTRNHRQQEIDQFPVGTGPFALKRYTKGSEIRYSAHPYYWVGTPKLHQLVFSITPDAGVRYQKLKTGECHVIAYPSPADLPSIEANPALRIEKKSGLNLSYLAMNTEKPPFNQALVRQAIAHALNKDSYIRAIYLGNAKKAISLYPDSVWSYDHSMTDYEFDPKKAKQLLAQAGYPNGFHTTLWTLPVTRAFNPNGKKMGEMMQKDLAAIGIQVKLMTFDWSTYLEKARLGEQEMMQLGWSGDTGDPDNFMYPLLSCDSVTRGSNNSRFCDKEFDRLIIAARTEKNQDIRAGLYQKAQRRLKEQTPIIPIAHAMVYRAVSDRVLGFELDSLDRERFFDIDLKAL